MLALIVRTGIDDARLHLLVRLFEQLRIAATPVDTVDAARRKLPTKAGERAFIVIPDLDSDPGIASSAITLAETTAQRAFVVYIADTISGDAYKALVRTGAGEWVKWQTLAPELLEVVRRRNAPHTGAGAPAQPATIVACVPTTGGAGTTTVAVEAAVHLASRKVGSNRACVLDLNFQNSSLPSYLDLEPRFQIAEIVGSPERLDEHLIEIFTTKHSSGIDVFCSPPTAMDYSKVEAEVIFAVLDEITRRYDYLFLDLPPVWLPWLDNLVLGSDAAVVVGAPTVPSIRRIADRAEWLDGLDMPGDRIAIVINKSSFGLFGGPSVRRSDIDRTLSNRKVFYVRQDAVAATEAVNAGRSILQNKRSRGLRKDVEAVGKWIEKVRAGPAKPLLT